jgi:hypothetical protein
MQPDVLAFEAIVRGTFGPSSQVLNDFGLKPRTPRVKTPPVKVQATQKALATRTARHTLGTRQKAGIHGTVPAAPASGSPPAPATGGSVKG